MTDASVLRVLHLEDDANDALFVERTLRQTFRTCVVRVARSRAEFLTALETGKFDIILSDHSVCGIDGLGALKTARERLPEIPFIFVSDSCSSERQAAALKAAGANDCLTKTQLRGLPPLVHRLMGTANASSSGILAAPVLREQSGTSAQYVRGMERLVL